MTTYVFPHPEELTWERWVSDVVQLNPDLANVVDGTLPWADFGNRLTLTISQAPRPDFFRTWQAWAEALKRATQG